MAGPVHAGQTDGRRRRSTSPGPGAMASPAPGWYQTSRGVEPRARTAGAGVAVVGDQLVGPGRAEAGDDRRRGGPRSRRAAPGPRRTRPSGSGWSGGPSGEGSTKHERAPGDVVGRRGSGRPTRETTSLGRATSESAAGDEVGRRRRRRPATGSPSASAARCRRRAARAGRPAAPTAASRAAAPGPRSVGSPTNTVVPASGSARLEGVDRAHHLDLDALLAQHLGQGAARPPGRCPRGRGSAVGRCADRASSTSEHQAEGDHADVGRGAPHPLAGPSGLPAAAPARRGGRAVALIAAPAVVAGSGSTGRVRGEGGVERDDVAGRLGAGGAAAVAHGVERVGRDGEGRRRMPGTPAPARPPPRGRCGPGGRRAGCARWPTRAIAR